jgi:putative Mg2+ transporter-C (MgtC) family protein
MDPILQSIVAVLLSAGLSSLVGLERETSHRPAGLRTHLLVCVGSTLLTLVAMQMFGTQADKIIQGIVTGIGFLGAGSIIASGRHVQGITTAATIWVIAIVGIVVGLGQYLLALFATVLIVIILQLQVFEKKV